MTAFKVEGGTLEAKGLQPLGQSQQLWLDGGEFAFSGTHTPGTAPGGAVAGWTFDDVTDATVVNEGSGGASMNGTMMAGVAVVPGIVGDGASFDGGTNAFVDVPSGVTELGDADFTITAWIKTGMAGAAILAKSDNAFDEWEEAEKQFYVSNSDSNSQRPVGSIDMVGWGTDWIGGDTPVNDDRWHHVAVTWNRAGTEGHVYVDGIEGTNYVGYNGRADNAGDLVRIGFDTSVEAAGNFNGLMDQVYVYDRVLTTEEISGTYGTATPPAMGNTDVLVTADSTLRSKASADVSFGALTLQGGTLTTAGANGISFNGTTIDATATAVGFDPQVETDYGAIDAGSASVVIAKAGPGVWTLATAPANMENAAWDVQGGTLEVLGEAPLAGRPVTLSGGMLAAVAADTATSAPAGAVAKWTFDNVDGTTVVNEGVGGAVMNGILSGDATIIPGKFNNALSLDGDADFVDVDHGVTEFGDDFTISVWLQTGTVGGAILGKSDLDRQWERYEKQFYVSGDGPDAGTGSPHMVGWGVDYINGNGTSVTDNQWHHVVVAFEESTLTRRMYVDGVDVTTDGGYNGNNDNLGNTVRIGYDNSGEATTDFNGLLDEVYVYNRALTAEQVAALYGGGNGPAVSEALSMANTNLRVTADSALSAVSDEAVLYGSLTLENGLLTTTGATTAIRFEDTRAAAGATVGFDTRVNTYPGPLAESWEGVTVLKTGPADLILDAPNFEFTTANSDQATFEVREGRMIGLKDIDAAIPSPNAFGTAALRLDGGEVVLAGDAEDGTVTFDNAVTVQSDSTLTAAAAAVGTAGPLTVVLGSQNAGLTVESGTLQLRTADQYRLEIAGTLSGAGKVAINEGTVTLAGGGGLASLEMDGGALNTTADVSIGRLKVDAGTLSTHSSLVTVRDRLILSGMTFAMEDADSFAVSGSDLLDNGVDRNLTLAGGTLSIGSGSGGPAGAIAIWKFDEGIGDVAEDSSAAGNDHLGAIVGATWVTDDPEHGTVLSFDGNQNYVEPDNGADFEFGSPISVAMWIKTDGAGVRLLGKGQGDESWQQNDKGLYINDADGKVEFVGWGNDYLRGTTNVADGNWHHVALTYNDTYQEQEIYIDGANDTSYRNYAGYPDSDTVFRLGYAEAPDFGGYRHYVGLMDDVYVYDRSLGADEVLSLYDSFGVEVDSLELPSTNLSVSQDSTLNLDTNEDVILGNLTIAADAALTITPVAASFNDVTTGSGASITGNALLVRGALSPGDGPDTLTIDGEFEMGSQAHYVCELAGEANDLLDMASDAFLDGTLSLKAVDSLGAVGDHSRTILVVTGEDEGEIIGTFANVPAAGDHLGHGVFHQDLRYPDTFTSVEIDVFQAAAGDANGDREVNNTDLQAILGAGSFGSPGDWDWTEGDFNGDGSVNNSDLQLILATGLFGAGTYAAGAGPAGAGMVAVPEPGTLLLLACGAFGLLLARRRRTRNG